MTDPVNGGSYDFYHNFYIDHQNGWYSWYLYAPLDSAILAQISLNGYAQVTKGQPILQLKVSPTSHIDKDGPGGL